MVESREHLTSEAAKELGKLGASKGGEARAQKLSPERRREIARAAIEARWAKAGKEPLPRATHSGTLTIGDVAFDVAVLEDGTRVVSEAKFMAAMGMYRSGALSVRRWDEGGANIPLFLAYKNLKPFAEKHLGSVQFEPRKYITPEGNTAHGIPATVIPKVCEIWLDAERAGTLGKRQKRVAEKADILLRGFAHVGIIALVDEATGFQDDRAKDALAKILEEFVAKELRPYLKTFPIDYYKEMYRLRGWRWPEVPAEQSRRSPLVGKLTDNVVYDRLAPGVKHKLKELIGRDERGRLRHKMFQRLTVEVGDPKLREHLASVVALMKAADTWEQFMHMLDRALKRYKPLPLFDPPQELSANTELG
jgi:hypothetical protein